MKTFLFLVVVAAALWWARIHSIEEDEKSRARELVIEEQTRELERAKDLAQQQNAAKPAAATPLQSGSFVTTPTATGGLQTRELKPGVSHMKSIGGGGGGGAVPKATPRNMLDQPAHR
jgi:hypothetical protein